MKNFILSAVLATIAAPLAMAQFSIGAGYLSQDFKVTNSYQSVTSSSTLTSQGFYLGVDSSYSLGHNFSISPGIYYGYVSKSKDGGSLKSHYLAVPFDVKYDFDLNRAIGIFVFAGPQFEYGLSSKFTYSSEGEQKGVNYTNSLYGDDGLFGRFNISLGTGFGVEVADKVRIRFGYHHGLLNLFENSDSGDSKAIHRFLNLGVAYLF